VGGVPNWFTHHLTVIHLFLVPFHHHISLIPHRDCIEPAITGGRPTPRQSTSPTSCVRVWQKNQTTSSQHPEGGGKLAEHVARLAVSGGLHLSGPAAGLSCISIRWVVPSSKLSAGRGAGREGRRGDSFFFEGFVLEWKGPPPLNGRPSPSLPPRNVLQDADSKHASVGARRGQLRNGGAASVHARRGLTCRRGAFAAAATTAAPSPPPAAPAAAPAADVVGTAIASEPLRCV